MAVRPPSSAPCGPWLPTISYSPPLPPVYFPVFASSPFFFLSAVSMPSPVRKPWSRL